MMYKRWQGPSPPAANGSSVERLTLGSNEDAPGLARAAIAGFAGRANEEALERATLLTSEAVTNAVKHADGAEIRVEIWMAAGSVAVVVSDDGPGFVPAAKSGTVADVDGGFGLPLLDTLSDAWGSGSDGNAWVWFQVSDRMIERPASVAQQAPHPVDVDLGMVADSVRGHALVALDLGGNLTTWGAAAEELTGYPAGEMLGLPLAGLFMSEGWSQGEGLITRKNGSELWIDVALAPILDRSGAQLGLSALMSDVTERRRADDARDHLISDLRELAMTDDLTGLPNRRRWSEELNRELARSRRHGTQLAVAMLDLNGFKAFNDANGHPAGDQLLQDVARAWSEAVRATDTLARYGGDEFAITLPECSPELAVTVVGRVQAATPKGIGASAGIASSDEAATAESVVANADAALYDAKRHHRAVTIAPTGPR